MTTTMRQSISAALGLAGSFTVKGKGSFPSRFPVTPLATDVLGAVGEAAAEIAALTRDQNPSTVTIDRRLASMWFGFSIDPIGWTLPPVWEALAGDYRARDGWIKLHTNLPHHRAAALRALGLQSAATKAAVESAVASSDAALLEDAIIAEGGVGAVMRSRDDWLAHPQGIALASEPLVQWKDERRRALPKSFCPKPGKPLAGLKILDLTRVLAGPVATRTLAGLGATVLRIDPPEWVEDNIVPDITLGKHCSRLDLRTTSDCNSLRELMARADVLVHGYRPGALDGLGFGTKLRAEINSNLIEVILDAYGWSGPWAERRGFDSLVQMSSGIAHAGMEWANRDHPTSLPVQALDHATGYLMAAAVMRSLLKSLKGETSANAQLSLARTANLLWTDEPPAPAEQMRPLSRLDYADHDEATTWGLAHRLRSPLQFGDYGLVWDRPALELGSVSDPLSVF